MSNRNKGKSEVAQDTGNPVLDSTVNLLRGTQWNVDALREVHKILLELAEKEPGGLQRRI